MERMRRKSLLKSICIGVLSFAMVLSVQVPIAQPVHAAQVIQEDNDLFELVDDIQEGVILNCWNWSYKEIEDEIDVIAQCGYSAIQTSPATQPKDYIYNGKVGVPGEDGGNWWKMYQPVTESVCDNGQTWLGSKADLESLCEKAEEYGMKVIVDVVANHMGNIQGGENSLSDVTPQVGTYWDKDMLKNESFWHINDVKVGMSESRLHYTQGNCGMPDLNTSNKAVQKYIADYLDELIDCGVDGFCFNKAKYIETPDDDPAFASDFWPTVMEKANKHYTDKTGEKLYVYGEVLDGAGEGLSIDSYTKYMKVTDNSAGEQLLESFKQNKLNTLATNYNPSDSILFAESPDSYMTKSSYKASDKTVARTWSMMANKNHAASLFFVRPYQSWQILEDDEDGHVKSDFKENMWIQRMGDGNLNMWASDEVVAVNHFNNRMAGKQENMGCDGNVAYCVRGEGIILTSMDGAGDISMSAHGLADGTYTDEVSGNTFTVSEGIIEGTITSEYGIAVIYKNVMPKPHGYGYIPGPWVDVNCSVEDGSTFYGESLSVTIDAREISHTGTCAGEAAYCVSTGESGRLYGSKTITIGEGLKKGESVTLTLTGNGTRHIISKTYTFYKDVFDFSNCVIYKGSGKEDSVTAYLWDYRLNGVHNAKWPGEKMYEFDEEEDLYALPVDPKATYNIINFSNDGANKTKDLAFKGTGKVYDSNTGTWSEYKLPDENTPRIKSTKKSSTITDPTDVTITVDNADQASYTLNGGKSVSFTGSTTVKVGENLPHDKTDTLIVTAANGEKTVTKTYTYTMNAKKLYVDMSECSWFTDDKATLGVKFDGEETYTIAKQITYQGVTYYQVAVPENAKNISICRWLPNWTCYNKLTFSMESGKNVWTAKPSLRSGTWSVNKGLGGALIK